MLSCVLDRNGDVKERFKLHARLLTITAMDRSSQLPHENLIHYVGVLSTVVRESLLWVGERDVSAHTGWHSFLLQLREKKEQKFMSIVLIIGIELQSH